MPRGSPRKPNMSDEELWEWFNTQLDKKENGCWTWKNGTNKAGYGQISVNKKLLGTHAYALQHKLGRPIHKNMLTRRLCNKPLCCNPDHLEEGTPKENMVDAIVAEGFEAGGHNGREETTTMCLIPLIVDCVS